MAQFEASQRDGHEGTSEQVLSPAVLFPPRGRIQVTPVQLTDGLCGDRSEHPGHLHDSVTLGRLWCTGDPDDQGKPAGSDTPGGFMD